MTEPYHVVESERNHYRAEAAALRELLLDAKQALERLRQGARHGMPDLCPCKRCYAIRLCGRIEDTLGGER